jgi:hypothetical protein
VPRQDSVAVTKLCNQGPKAKNLHIVGGNPKKIILQGVKQNPPTLQEGKDLFTLFYFKLLY